MGGEISKLAKCGGSRNDDKRKRAKDAKKAGKQPGKKEPGKITWGATPKPPFEEVASAAAAAAASPSTSPAATDVLGPLDTPAPTGQVTTMGLNFPSGKGKGKGSEKVGE